MHPVIQSLKAALDYAKFLDEDIANTTLALITELGNDLDAGEDGVMYDAGTRVEYASSRLEVAMNNFDASREDTSALINDARDIEVVEEDDKET